MKNDGVPVGIWLDKVDLDQNVKKIDLIANIFLGGMRKFFLSKVLGLNYRMGDYDNLTKMLRTYPRDIIGLMKYVSVQETEFVIPDGETWELIGISCKNGSQSTYWGGYYSKNAGSDIVDMPITSQFNALSTNGSGCVNFPKPIILTGSGTDVVIYLYSESFTAADNINVSLTYRRLN